MEDRKRPGGPEDSAPPSKRQAVSVNGSKPPQEDVPWKEDIEAFQKDAIWRQMREYKREKTTCEAELRSIEKRSKHHDDHLRTIDLWFDQLVDEIKIRSGVDPSSASQDGPEQSIPAILLSSETEQLAKHLSGRKEKIMSALSGLFSRFPQPTPEVAGLQQQLSKLLAKEKEHIRELQSVITEKEHMSDRLDSATHRYMIAEKKIDRIKSAQVQKLERQLIASGSNGGMRDDSSSAANGADAATGASATLHIELETARNQAMAEAAKKKEQLEQLEIENKKLTEEVTSLNVKLAGLSDDDYAKTDLFKVIKSQHEDVIRRINHLEATNIQLREEAKKYQAERTEYRIKLDDEARGAISESEGNVARAEADLARIRHSRDELLAKVSMLDSSLQNNQASRAEARELMDACENRISALESECERLRLQGLQLTEQQLTDGHQPTDLANMTPEQLGNKIKNLENQIKLLNNELPAMESAWKKAQAVAGRKIADIAVWEENLARANADKAKADQKFFAAMKAKETLGEQNRMLRAQATKSTEIVAQLKEADHLSRSLVDKIEKQCAELRAQTEELSNQHRTLQQKLNESLITTEGQAQQIGELKKTLEVKDSSYIAAKHAQRQSEVEQEKLKLEVEGLHKQCEVWKKKSQGNQSEETHMMQNMLQCQVCKTAFKNTVIRTCGHVFCEQCIQDRLINRARKCPSCGKAFGNNDTMRIHL